jgi:hypothetical protein
MPLFSLAIGLTEAFKDREHNTVSDPLVKSARVINAAQ